MNTRHIARKRFSQNFLINEFVIEQIIEIINPQKEDFLIEIGPGLAALTMPLLNYIQKLRVVEIDRDIINYLKEKFDVNKIEIFSADALKFDFTFNNEKIRVVGNLPYNISTPLLFHLMKFNNILDMHFMLQKEVVSRICAKPNSHEYGKLTVMLQYKYNCEKMLDVGKECFKPQPKVESAIVKIMPKPNADWEGVDIVKLEKVVGLAFQQRRKTINNSLKQLFDKKKLNDLGIDENKRAENLTINEYKILAKAIGKN
ncbi:MAG TPA: 16S rRNA (adenine(1518)-N(6)/adenine(1519)-N(6))-dimethyltransferase RsmA [Burkholderiales bacterium]|nr:16S rRNA (adenine(1518)-N(6)/adenine(1519)-N(6))-dimethyltransferase RsmA [Burkholderiales bacterium]